MRTTLTLDPDVSSLVRARMSERQATMKEVVNEALRVGLSANSPKNPRKRFRVKPFSLGLRPGIDPNRLNQLLDEMDAEYYAAAHAAQQK